MAEKPFVTSRGELGDHTQRGDGATEVAAIPLVEERLQVSKRQVESGRVRIHVSVDERQETVTQDLIRDDVEIERVARNIPLADMPHVRLEGTTTIIPVVEEVLVVEKKLMLVEEIHVRRRSNMERREVPVTVRSERAEIEREEVNDRHRPSDPHSKEGLS
jgi:uncharacterized protein (TIGR02271 family)